MHQFFLDASALAKRYVAEKGSHLIHHLFANASAQQFQLLNIGAGEVVSLLVRKRNAGVISPVEYAKALAAFGHEIAHNPAVAKKRADTAHVTLSFSYIVNHSLNATDAIVLVLALQESSSLQPLGERLVLVASDQRLLQAAMAEGLTTFDPQVQSQADLDALLGP